MLEDPSHPFGALHFALPHLARLDPLVPETLVRTLDVMPCDYRYFVGKENPLDKLVEAAAMLEELEERFRKL